MWEGGNPLGRKRERDRFRSKIRRSAVEGVESARGWVGGWMDPTGESDQARLAELPRIPRGCAGDWIQQGLDSISLEVVIGGEIHSYSIQTCVL